MNDDWNQYLIGTRREHNASNNTAQKRKRPQSQHEVDSTAKRNALAAASTYGGHSSPSDFISNLIQSMRQNNANSAAAQQAQQQTTRTLSADDKLDLLMTTAKKTDESLKQILDCGRAAQESSVTLAVQLTRAINSTSQHSQSAADTAKHMRNSMQDANEMQKKLVNVVEQQCYAIKEVQRALDKRLQQINGNFNQILNLITTQSLKKPDPTLRKILQTAQSTHAETVTIREEVEFAAKRSRVVGPTLEMINRKLDTVTRAGGRVNNEAGAVVAPAKGVKIEKEEVRTATHAKTKQIDRVQETKVNERVNETVALDAEALANGAQAADATAVAEVANKIPKVEKTSDEVRETEVGTTVDETKVAEAEETDATAVGTEADATTAAEKTDEAMVVEEANETAVTEKKSTAAAESNETATEKDVAETKVSAAVDGSNETAAAEKKDVAETNVSAEAEGSNETAAAKETDAAMVVDETNVTAVAEETKETAAAEKTDVTEEEHDASKTAEEADAAMVVEENNATAAEKSTETETTAGQETDMAVDGAKAAAPADAAEQTNEADATKKTSADDKADDILSQSEHDDDDTAEGRDPTWTLLDACAGDDFEPILSPDPQLDDESEAIFEPSVKLQIEEIRDIVERLYRRQTQSETTLAVGAKKGAKAVAADDDVDVAGGGGGDDAEDDSQPPAYLAIDATLHCNSKSLILRQCPLRVQIRAFGSNTKFCGLVDTNASASYTQLVNDSFVEYEDKMSVYLPWVRNQAANQVTGSIRERISFGDCDQSVEFRFQVLAKKNTRHSVNLLLGRDFAAAHFVSIDHATRIMRVRLDAKTTVDIPFEYYYNFIRDTISESHKANKPDEFVRVFDQRGKSATQPNATTAQLQNRTSNVSASGSL